MKISVYDTYLKMSEAAAELVVEQVALKPNSVLCFPSGDTPTSMLHYLVGFVSENKVDFSQCYFVGLDEWIGMDENDAGSCKHYLHSNLFNKLNLAAEKIFLFDAKAADLNKECESMNDFIREKGGLDIMIVGIGLNGHIGLNEPGTDFNSYTHLSELAASTIQVGQKYFKNPTDLKGGITLGLRHFAEAKKAVLIASGAKKAAIVAQSIQGKISEDVPASIIQTIAQSEILLDKEAASQLDQKMVVSILK